MKSVAFIGRPSVRAVHRQASNIGEMTFGFSEITELHFATMSIL